jgi:hypothetical protein
MEDEKEIETKEINKSLGMEKMISMMSKIDDILATVGRYYNIKNFIRYFF